MSTVNDNIRNFRIFRRMSQKRLGAKIGKSPNVISNWELGIHSPDLEYIEKICAALKVTPSQLFGWEENPEYLEHRNRLQEIQNQIDDLNKQKENIDREIADLEKMKYIEQPPFIDEDD